MPHSLKLDHVEVIWHGHASFHLTDGDKHVYIDPFVLPAKPEKADVILITHEHFDHCDPEKIKHLQKLGTKIIGAQSAIKKIGHGQWVSPNFDVNMDKISIRSTEAYNTNKFREPGQPFHPRGLGIGFVVTFNGRTIYHSGDTDKISEMAALNNIDVALLPIGGTYTMTAHEAAEAAISFKPKNLIPMHYNSDKYGVTGINANPIDVAKGLVGKGVMVRILEPMV